MSEMFFFFYFQIQKTGKNKMDRNNCYSIYCTSIYNIYIFYISAVLKEFLYCFWKISMINKVEK